MSPDGSPKGGARRRDAAGARAPAAERRPGSLAKNGFSAAIPPAILAALALFGCAGEQVTQPPAPAGRWAVRSDSANVAILQFDGRTFAFEGGSLRRYALCRDCDLDSLPFAYSRRAPDDFGWHLFRYLGTQDTVLYATEVFMGSGEIVVPPALLPPDSFAAVSGVLRPPVSMRAFATSMANPRADTAWAAARRLDITQVFSRGAYRVGLFWYWPDAGIGTRQKWIVFLYSGSQPTPWRRPE
jgi:hypothetical protein